MSKPVKMNKRSKMVRYSPARAKEIRDEIAKHPNPMFGRMLAEGRMSDGDLVDFAFNVTHAYFSGALLEPIAAAVDRDLKRVELRTFLTTAALFGMTATFEKDGLVILKDAWSDDDPNRQTDAVQALVDIGLSVKDAMAAFKTGPPKEGRKTEPIETRLPAHEVVH